MSEPRRQTNLDERSARELVEMRYAEPLAEFNAAMGRLHAAAVSEDPHVYSACIAAAFSAVLKQFDRVYGAVLSWGEENPDGDWHMHSVSAMYKTPKGGNAGCVCKTCLLQYEHALRCLSMSSAEEPTRYVNQLLAQRERERESDQPPITH